MKYREIPSNELQKKAGIHRSNFIDVIKRLENKCIISRELIGKNYIIKLNIDIFKKIIKESIKSLNGFKDFISKLSINRKEGDVIILKGEEALNFLFPIIKKAKEIKIFPTKLLFFEKKFDKYLETIRNILSPETKVKRIIIDYPNLRKIAENLKITEKNTEYKFISKDFIDIDSNITIIDNRITILTFFLEDIKVICIFSKEISTFLSKLFDILWEKLEK